MLQLRKQHAELGLKGINLELQFSVSINAVSTLDPVYESRLSNIGASFRHHQVNLGDVNINLGFLDASRSNADLFWIVSPGDKVSDTALENIVDFFERNTELDFIVADEEDRGIRDLHLTSKGLDFRMLSEASFGMVTGLVYRLQAFRPFLHHGLQASFTGWGQLAVFLGATHNPNGIRGRILPSDYFYYRGDSKILSHDSKVENMRNYAHSFFGFVVLISLISPTPNTEVRRWVRSNFLRIGAYHRAYSKPTNDFVRLTDLRKMAHMIVRNTDLLTRTLFFLSSKVDFTSLKRILDHAR